MAFYIFFNNFYSFLDYLMFGFELKKNLFWNFKGTVQFSKKGLIQVLIIEYYSI